MPDKSKTEKILTLAFLTLVLLPSFLMICGGLRRTPSYSWAVAYLPNGEEIVTVGAQGLSADGPHHGELTFWNATTLQKRLSVGSDWGLRSLACSPDGKFVLIGDSAGQRKLVDARTGRAAIALAPHSKIVNGAAASAKAGLFATGSFDGTIKVCDAEGADKMTLNLPEGEVSTVAVSPDGKFVVAGGRKGIAYEFDLTEQGKWQLVVAGPPTAGVEAAAFAPDGITFATGCERHLKIWDAGTCDMVCDIVKFDNDVCGLKFSPDGKTIAAVDLDGTLSLLNAVTHEFIHSTQAHSGGSYAVDYSPNGNLIATVGSADGELKIWDARTLRPIASGTE